MSSLAPSTDPQLAFSSSRAPRIVGFASARPAFDAGQEEALEWLSALHAMAERSRAADPEAFDVATFQTRLRKLLYRYGCSPDKIARRGYEIADGHHTSWAEMRIYDVVRRPEGAGSHARTELFAAAAAAAFARLYAEDAEPPTDLLHVTCTGYASPSAAQRLVADRGWGDRTRVTHAYHMGCYASMPAIRLAAGLLATAPETSPREGKRARYVDIVHNEVCTLHLRPADHSPEQLVVQSLFADGHIRYCVAPPGADVNGGGLEVRAVREHILPDCAAAMGWVVSDHGMYMTLARDVPNRIAAVVREFVARLFEDAGLDWSADRETAIVAVHPGGPKVIDVIQKALELRDAQVEASRGVLRDYGNMSSATLPHVWMRLATSPLVAAGTPIASLAFGPGLTVCGAVMVKR